MVRDEREVILLVWEGNGNFSLSKVWMGKKREGNFSFLFVMGNGKEMGSNLRVLPVWEGNGKKILNMFGVGGKWEGSNKCFFLEERKKKEKLEKVSKICPKSVKFTRFGYICIFLIFFSCY